MRVYWDRYKPPLMEFEGYKYFIENNRADFRIPIFGKYENIHIIYRPSMIEDKLKNEPEIMNLQRDVVANYLLNPENINDESCRVVIKEHKKTWLKYQNPARANNLRGIINEIEIFRNRFPWISEGMNRQVIDIEKKLFNPLAIYYTDTGIRPRRNFNLPPEFYKEPYDNLFTHQVQIPLALRTNEFNITDPIIRMLSVEEFGNSYGIFNYILTYVIYTAKSIPVNETLDVTTIGIWNLDLYIAFKLYIYQYFIPDEYNLITLSQEDQFKPTQLPFFPINFKITFERKTEEHKEGRFRIFCEIPHHSFILDPMDHEYIIEGNNFNGEDFKNIFFPLLINWLNDWWAYISDLYVITYFIFGRITTSTIINFDPTTVNRSHPKLGHLNLAIINILKAFGYSISHKILDIFCIEDDLTFPCLFNVLSYIKGLKQSAKMNYFFSISNTLREDLKKGSLKALIEILNQENKTWAIYFPITDYIIGDDTAMYKLIYYQKHIRIIKNPKKNKFKYIQNALIKKNPMDIKPKKIQDTIKYQNYYLDIETWTNKENIQIPYLIILLNENLEVNQFWGKDCIDVFTDWLYGCSKENIIIWTFNGSKFDTILLIDTFLSNFRSNILGTLHDIKCLYLNNNIQICDMKLLLGGGSLDNNSQLFGTEHKKSYFDISFKDTNYFEENKKDIIKYCINDCIVLKELHDKFFQFINTISYNDIQFNCQFVFSIANLAYTIWSTLFCDFIIEGNSLEDFQIEKSSYYGGYCNCFKKYGKNLYYYDINSSYPFVMLSKIPIKLQKINKKNIINFIDTNLYFVEVHYYKTIKITNLPIREKYGLYYYYDVPKSWRWGCELLLIQKYNLGKIICYEERIYNTESIFANYINFMYINRKKAIEQKNQGMKQFYKLLMNSLYGKFGQKQYNRTYYTKPEFLAEYLLNKEKKIILTELELDYIKIQYKETDDMNWIGNHVKIASYITAKARSNLLNVIYEIGEDYIYYCDTDSIIISKDLPEYLKSNNELGKWKLEMKIKEACFYSSKLYYMIGEDDEKHIKAKGVKHPDQIDFSKNINEVINDNIFEKKGVGKITIQNQIKHITIENKRKKLINNDYYNLK